MKKISLLTAKDSEDFVHDDHLLEEALETEGIEYQVRPWEELEDQGEDLFLVRTTWNYTDHLETFLNKLASVQDRLWNPLPLIKWNSNKKYLLELADKGVEVMPLRLAHDKNSLQEAMQELGGEEFVVKPLIGAGAKGLVRFSKTSPPEIQREMIVQKFSPQIKEGELSLIFFDGDFSHAIRKTPVEGEIRVQEEFGGAVSAHDPSSEEMRMAKKAAQCIPGPWLYARVDIVPGAGIIELECVEPSLFFGSHPDACRNLLEGLKKKLK